MKLTPMEPKWIDTSAMELFKLVEAERDRLVQQMRIDMGDIEPDGPLTATALSAHKALRLSAQRRMEIEASYRPLLDGFHKKLADIVGRYTVPQAILQDDTKN